MSMSKKRYILIFCNQKQISNTWIWKNKICMLFRNMEVIPAPTTKEKKKKDKNSTDTKQ